MKDKHTALETALASKDELLQTLMTGVSSNNDGNSGGGYLGQIADARGRISQGHAEEEQANRKLDMAQKELKSLQDRWKTVEREAKDAARNLDGMRAAVEDLKKKIEELTQRSGALENALRTLFAAVSDEPHPLLRDSASPNGAGPSASASDSPRTESSFE